MWISVSGFDLSQLTCVATMHALYWNWIKAGCAHKARYAWLENRKIKLWRRWVYSDGEGGTFEAANSLANAIKIMFLHRAGLGVWRRAFWVPVGVSRSKCEQHLYRCCVIFIALLHLLGGISFSVNNQVNCIQTLSGTPANFFIVTLTQAIFFPLFPTPPLQKKTLFPFSSPTWTHGSCSAPKLSMKEGFMVPWRKSDRAVCSNGCSSQEVAMLSYIPLLSGKTWPYSSR